MIGFTGRMMLFLILLCPLLRAQEERKPIAIHPAVGDTLRLADRNRYQLLPLLEGFRYATFALNPDSTLRVRARVVSQGVEKDTVIPRYRTLASLRRHIDQMQPVEKIRLKDGSTLVGLVDRRSADSIEVRTQGMGSVRIPLAQVEGIEPYDQAPELPLYAAEPAPDTRRDTLVDPNSTRAFIMPSAQTLPAGHGFIANYELFLLTLGVAVNDHVMVNGGLTLMPGFEDQLYTFGIKIGTGNIGKKVGFGIGAQFFAVRDESPVGFGFAVVSFGDSDAKLNLGAGVAFSTESRDTSPAIFALSGETRIARSVKLLAELWVLPDGEVLPTIIGVRFFGGQLSGDIGMMYFLGESGGPDSPVGFPVVNVVYTF